MTVEPIAALRDRRVDAPEVYIGIIGQGYVGVPLALTFADNFRVLGFDVDALRVRRARETKLFEATADFTRLHELVQRILEQGGLTAGVDFFLAFSPEREDPGNKSYSTPTIPKVVGGIDAMSGDVARSPTRRTSMTRGRARRSRRFTSS